MMQATLDHVTTEATAISSFYFKPAKPFNYTAGQFVEITLPHPNADKRGDRRWFTLSSSPDQALIRITTKFSAGLPSTFKQALAALSVGETVTLSDPLGDFVLPRLASVPLIFVAGGIGVTPFISMFESIIGSGESRAIRFLYAVNNEDEIIFQDIFERANQHATIVVTKPSAAWGGERGLLTAEMILGLKKPSPGTLVYIAGPELFMHSLSDDLVDAGLKKSQLVTDYFPGYASF